MRQRTTKSTKWHVRSVKTQISLRIRPVRLAPVSSDLSFILISLFDTSTKIKPFEYHDYRGLSDFSMRREIRREKLSFIWFKKYNQFILCSHFFKYINWNQSTTQSDQSDCPHEKKLGSKAAHWMNSVYSNQTGWMPRLIRVFAWRISILLVLSWGDSYFLLENELFVMVCLLFLLVSLLGYLFWFRLFPDFSNTFCFLKGACGAEEQYRDQTWFFMHKYTPGPEGGVENRGRRPRFSTPP